MVKTFLLALIVSLSVAASASASTARFVMAPWGGTATFHCYRYFTATVRSSTGQPFSSMRWDSSRLQYYWLFPTGGRVLYDGDVFVNNTVEVAVVSASCT